MNCSTTSPSETPPTAHKRRSHQQLAQRLSFIDKIMLAPCWFAFFGCVAKPVCATARRLRHLVLVPPASVLCAENKIEQDTPQLAGWYWTAAVGAARRPKLPRHPFFKPTSNASRWSGLSQQSGPGCEEACVSGNTLQRDDVQHGQLIRASEHGQRQLDCLA